MNFQEVIGNFVNVVSKKYFCFDGRTGRKSFWLFVLVNFVISTILGMIPGIGQVLSAVWFLAVLCPSLGITARRLHDTGRSAWNLLWAFLPVIGWIVLLVFYCQGSREPNQYGEGPDSPDA